MLFNSYLFILIFLPLTWSIYFGLNKMKWYKAAQGELILASLIFYGFYNWKYLFVMLVSILVNYTISIFGGKYAKKRTIRKLIVIVGIIFNIGILIYFKYMDFFVENINYVCHADFAVQNLILPLGISFYTFQQISFLIDTYRKDITYHFLDYAEFVAFFPQLVAGPIVSHEIISQFNDTQRKEIDFDYMSRGLFLFSIGLLKKIIIADTFAKAVDWGFTSIGDMSSLEAVIVMLSYTFQIYFDFSGYSDMALGLAALFNIDLPVNFSAPYQADSIVEFWEKWHMTLTEFLRKYVYFPLGGSKKSIFRTYINIFIVFLVSGLWHGANWTFIVWGAVHGIANICNRIFEKRWSKVNKCIRWICTFVFLCFTWLIFRAGSLAQAGQFFKLLSCGTTSVSKELALCFVLPEVNLFCHVLGLYSMDVIYYIIMLSVFAGAFLVVLRIKPYSLRKFEPSLLNALGTIICFIWSVLSLAENSIFIYFGF